MTKQVSKEPFAVLNDLTARALTYLKSKGYSRGTLGHFRSTWRQMVALARECSLPDAFSQELADRFLAKKGVPLHGGPLNASHRHLRRAMDVLFEFSAHGTVCIRKSTVAPPILPPALSDALDQYLEYCSSKLDIRPKTILHRRHQIAAFLGFVEDKGVNVASEICGKHLSGFIQSRAHFSTRTLATLASTLRSFLRIGCVLGWMPTDLSAEVPKIQVRPDARIPTVWNEKDVEALLDAVDTVSSVGKRDRVILLLACRLGLRVGDIRTLTLDALKWTSARISFSQQKTGRVVDLPLSDEIADALIDYLRNGRPATDYREIFLRANAPFLPFSENSNLHEIVTRYRRRAGILVKPKAPKGMHTLRHTLASRLLAEGNSLETIGAILGHKSLDATRRYTKVDIDALRSVALDMPGEVI